MFAGILERFARIDYAVPQTAVKSDYAAPRGFYAIYGRCDDSGSSKGVIIILIYL
jgi:hypothetical protein